LPLCSRFCILEESLDGVVQDVIEYQLVNLKLDFSIGRSALWDHDAVWTYRLGPD
jgi:hypothetical protein